VGLVPDRRQIPKEKEEFTEEIYKLEPIESRK
jgi:hypothetical protein